jgi:hypothetical protein
LLAHALRYLQAGYANGCNARLRHRKRSSSPCRALHASSKASASLFSPAVFDENYWARHSLIAATRRDSRSSLRMTSTNPSSRRTPPVRTAIFTRSYSPQDGAGGLVRTPPFPRRHRHRIGQQPTATCSASQLTPIAAPFVSLLCGVRRRIVNLGHPQSRMTLPRFDTRHSISPYHYLILEKHLPTAARDVAVLLRWTAVLCFEGLENCLEVLYLEVQRNV